MIFYYYKDIQPTMSDAFILQTNRTILDAHRLIYLKSRHNKFSKQI